MFDENEHIHPQNNDEGDVYKRQVQYEADIAASAELRRVLLDILDTPVSPELLPAKDGEISQKTEDLVGPYELHDFYLYYVLRFGFGPSKIFRLAKAAFAGRAEYPDEVLYKWLRNFYWRFFAQQFKRSCLPDGPKVGSVTLSPCLLYTSSESNINHLRQIVHDIDTGKAKLTEHELIEMCIRDRHWTGSRGLRRSLPERLQWPWRG